MVINMKYRDLKKIYTRQDKSFSWLPAEIRQQIMLGIETEMKLVGFVKATAKFLEGDIDDIFKNVNDEIMYTGFVNLAKELNFANINNILDGETYILLKLELVISAVEYAGEPNGSEATQIRMLQNAKTAIKEIEDILFIKFRK